MTLTSSTVRVQYSGDGSTTSFSVPFIFWTDDDLKVILTDSDGVETTWTRGTQYTVTGDPGTTGTIEVITSPTDYTPATGETLTILSNLSDTQDTDLIEGGQFPTASVEQQLDQIVRQIQQAAEELGRTVQFVESSTVSGPLGLPDPVASQFLRWNTGATDLENADLASLGALGLPVAVADGGTGAITAAAARTNLGLGTGDSPTFTNETLNRLDYGWHNTDSGRRYSPHR